MRTAQRTTIDLICPHPCRFVMIDRLSDLIADSQTLAHHRNWSRTRQVYEPRNKDKQKAENIRVNIVIQRYPQGVIERSSRHLEGPNVSGVSVTREGTKSPIARTLRRRRPFRLLNLSSSQGLMNELHDATTNNSSKYERSHPQSPIADASA